ncbi:hypothetical protein EDD11_004525 [Mortierella claussenii]|nr:hypothetical protein EDD11_004525 [Mortierella claussenii]
MNVKSRWKSEYLRVTSSSPSGSFISAISEILPDVLPEILPGVMMVNGDNRGKMEEEEGVNASPVTENVAELMVEPGISAGPSKEAMITDGVAALPTVIAPVVARMQQEGPDLVEQDILLKLEELKKEKSRLFSLFRTALQKKEKEVTPQPLPTPPSASALAPTATSASSATETVSSVTGQSPLATVTEEEALGTTTPQQQQSSKHSADSSNQSAVTGGMESRPEMRRHGSSRRPSDHQDFDNRRPESSRPNFKRYFGGKNTFVAKFKVIDRSKLNLEIPRKPSLSSISSNSTASTPTPTSTGFSLHSSSLASSSSHPYGLPTAPSSSSSSSSSSNLQQKGKRQRSISPSSIPDGPAASRSAVLFGGGHLHHHHYQDSMAGSKYPRADYMGSSSYGRNGNDHRNSGGYSGLPDKPQTKHPSTITGSRGDGYHGEDGYLSRGKNGGPFSSMPSSGGGGGSYRQNTPLGYQPPPTRIGFGSSSGNGNSSSQGSGSSLSGGRNGGNGGYHGNGDGKLGSPMPGRGIPPFSRTMMQIPPPHSGGRTMVQGRAGFGSAHGYGHGSVGGGRGSIGGGGPVGRLGDWPRRRSRV